MTERRGSNIVKVHVDNNVLTLADTKLRRASIANPDFAAISNDAKASTEAEKHMSIAQALRLYSKADTILSLLANFFALGYFNRKYGTYDAATGNYQISAAWKSGLTNGASVGEILGLFAAAIIQDRIGYRKTLMGALVMVVCFIFITFFAVDLPMLLFGEILCGIPWDVFQTITTGYASEVCSIQLRAYLTTYVNLCWVFGQLIGSGVLRAMVSDSSANADRIPFAIQPGGRHDGEHTNTIEKEISAGNSYWDCFTGIDLRRTEIRSIAWLVQSVCGSTFMGYSTVFYEQAGLPTAASFDMSMAQYALGTIGTIGSWFLMGYMGRRNIYLYGASTLCALLFIIGMVGMAPSTNSAASWAIGSMLLIFTFIYDLTVGPGAQVQAYGG